MNSSELGLSLLRVANVAELDETKEDVALEERSPI
jgi:hypothetical protein